MDPIERLRTVLALNAATTAVAGIVCAVAAEPVAGLLSTEHAGVVRVVGVGLVLFAADLLVLRAAHPRRLVVGSKVAAVADAGWSAGTVIVALAGLLDPLGVALVLATGLVTGALAVLEWTGADHAAGATVSGEEALA